MSDWRQQICKPLTFAFTHSFAKHDTNISLHLDWDNSPNMLGLICCLSCPRLFGLTVSTALATCLRVVNMAQILAADEEKRMWNDGGGMGGVRVYIPPVLHSFKHFKVLKVKQEEKKTKKRISRFKLRRAQQLLIWVTRGPMLVKWWLLKDVGCKNKATVIVSYNFSATLSK